LCDFNFPEIKWDKNDVFGVNTVSYYFLETINELGLHQLVSTPTLEKNILDLVLCSHKLLVQNLEVGPPFSSSDHNSISFDLLNLPLQNRNLIN